MKRSILENFLGKEVEVKLFDKEVTRGVLHKTGEEEFKNSPSLFLPQDWFFCVRGGVPSYMFRSSHVEKCREVGR